MLGLTWPRELPFRPGERPRVRPVMWGGGRRASRLVPVFCCLSAADVASWPILCLLGVQPPSRSAYRSRKAGPQRGFDVPRVLAAAGRGDALYAQGTAVPTPTGSVPNAACRLTTAGPCTSGATTCHRGFISRGIRRGFKLLTHPIDMLFPSPEPSRSMAMRSKLDLCPRTGDHARRPRAMVEAAYKGFVSTAVV